MMPAVKLPSFGSFWQAKSFQAHLFAVMEPSFQPVPQCSPVSLHRFSRQHAGWLVSVTSP